jgi:hypothetical protein
VLAAVEPVGETAEDTDDTTVLIVPARTEPDEDPAVPGEESPVPSTPGSVPESVAADAGRAKITERTRASMSAPARPLQAYRHSRRAPALVLGRPTLEGRA